MSLQAGIVYFDGRNVPPNDSAAILKCIRYHDENKSVEHREPGVLLAQSAGHPFSQASLTFDGRFDNREDLRSRTGQPAGGTDAALAHAVYEKWGVDGLAHLIGDWSLALWNGPQRTLVLASDFAGVRPLYYSVEAGRVVWSTRLEPLVEWLGGIEIDEQYAGGFLVSAASPNRTPYRGIFSVPPGHAVSIAYGTLKIQRFWTLPVAERIRYRETSEYAEHLFSLFGEAVRCRLDGEAPVLAELSGGLDSSSVVCMAKHQIDRGIVRDSRLVTITHEHEGSLDTRFYTAVENFCGFEKVHVQTASHPFLTENDTGAATPAFWQHLHTHISNIARQTGAKTYLTGNPGDLVMGNWWDDSDQVAGFLRRGRIKTALEQSLAWSKALRVPIWWILGRAMLSNLPPSLALQSMHPVADGSHSPRMTEDSIAPAFRARMESPAADAGISQDWKHAPPERRKHFRGLMEMLALRKLQPPEPLEHLAYTHPFAHRPLMAFLLSIPAEILCGPGEPRRLMRRAFQSIWPAPLHQRRSKDSFGGVYLDSLRPLAAMLLQDTHPLQVVERGWVDSQSLKKRLELMLHSLDCNEPQLRNIILFELWLRGRDHRLQWKSLSLPA